MNQLTFLLEEHHASPSVSQDCVADFPMIAEISHPIGRNNGQENVLAIQGNLIGRDKGGPNGIGVSGDAMFTLTKSDVHVVRRLMPIECERLMGFPDNYTNIKGATDANRYKALGNSMAVPVMRWIGERIKLIDG